MRWWRWIAKRKETMKWSNSVLTTVTLYPRRGLPVGVPCIVWSSFNRRSIEKGFTSFKPASFHVQTLFLSFQINRILQLHTDFLVTTLWYLRYLLYPQIPCPAYMRLANDKGCSRDVQTWTTKGCCSMGHSIVMIKLSSPFCCSSSIDWIYQCMRWDALSEAKEVSQETTGGNANTLKPSHGMGSHVGVFNTYSHLSVAWQ